MAPASGEEEPSITPVAKIEQCPPKVAIASSSEGWTSVVKSESVSKGDIKTDALRTETGPRESTAASLPKVIAPPELSIPLEELEKDKALFAAFAEQRGEKRGSAQQWNPDWQEDGEEEDVNGFGNTAEGRKAKKRVCRGAVPAKTEPSLNVMLFQKHKRKRDVSPGQQALVVSLRMDADYDVRTPNDYNEFKALVRSRREAVKQMKREQRAEEARKESKGYLGRDIEDDESESEEEDSYRRSKMGKFAPPAIYHQASAPSKLASASPFDDDDEKPYLSPPPSMIPDHSLPSVANLSGEEAYQRRLAMSQSHATAAAIDPTDQANKPQAIDLAAKAALAASIAARLAKAAPSQDAPTAKPVPPSFVSTTMPMQDSASFAEKLMEKQGWKKGEALGADGNKGILDPILAEKVEAERRKMARSAERPLQSNRGTIINAREDEKRRAEREEYGTVSSSHFAVIRVVSSRVRYSQARSSCSRIW